MRKERLTLVLAFILIGIFPLLSSATYSTNTYGCGIYGQGCSDAVSVTGGVSTGGGAIGIQFDIKILDFDSPVNLGEFFDFTYFVKGIGSINNDVTIDFWIEKDEEIITSGSDVIFMGNNEEKTESASLFLPENIDSGTYKFVIRVSYGNIKAEVHRTIELTVIDGGVIIDSLFDIRFLLEETLMQNSDDLSAVVIFENFGLGATLVNLTFIILDESGNGVHSKQETITVETERILRKSFEGLNLDEGKYTLILNTLYNVDVFDEFKQEFEIRKERRGITGLIIEFVEGERKWWVIGVIVSVLVIVLVWFFIRGKKKKIKKHTKRREAKIYKKLEKEVGDL